MTRRRRSGSVVTTAIAACLAVVCLRGQSPNPGDMSSRLDQWLGAVLTHTPGDLDAAAEVVARRSHADLNELLGGLQKQFKAFLAGRAPVEFSSILRRHGVVDQPTMNRALKVAALLHADVAMLHRTRAGYALPPDERSIRVLSDGRQVGTRGGTPHWAFARALLDETRPQPVTDEYSRVWYQATSAFFQHWSDYAEGPPHLQRARTLFPADAVLMMYDGALHEAYADPRVQRAVVAFRGPMAQRANDSPEFVGVVSQAVNEWRVAESRFREALKVDPTLTEARVRLGHVLERQGRLEAATTELERALADRPSGVLEYYTLIFLGRSEHARGRLDAATRAFDRARALYPDAQSPQLGLSEIARDAGNRLAAIDALGLVIAPRTHSRDDPYWRYHQTHSPDLDARLADLRRATVELLAAPLSNQSSADPRPDTPPRPR